MCMCMDTHARERSLAVHLCNVAYAAPSPRHAHMQNLNEAVVVVLSVDSESETGNRCFRDTFGMHDKELAIAKEKQVTPMMMQ